MSRAWICDILPDMGTPRRMNGFQKERKMDYGIFAQMAEGTWKIEEGETRKDFMKRTFLAVCSGEETGGQRIINDMMAATLEDCDPDAGTLALSFRVEDWMRNPMGTMHGGLLTTCVDLTIGTLTRFLRGGGHVSTVTLNMNFQRPVPYGETVVIEARMDKNGGRVAFLGANGFLKEGHKPCCRATGIFM